MKKQPVIFLLLLLAFVNGHAQSTAGITGVRDTSYSTWNEYQKHQKNYPGLQIAPPVPVQGITEITGITCCSMPQRQLKLDLYYVPAVKTAPQKTAIIFIHGGGWRSGNKAMHQPLLQRLALLGYVCIAPEYRLSTEALYPAAVHDIKTAIRWVRKNAAHYNINSNKIVVAGHSAGGQLAAFMGATNGMKAFDGDCCFPKISSRANAVINLDGTLAFIHPESGEGDDSKKTSAATYWFGWPKTENPAVWKQAAPLTHAGLHCPPFLFINSGVARMHAGRDDFTAILNKHHIYYQVKTLEGAPHSFILFKPWMDTAVAYMDKFIGHVFSVPAKNSRIITVAQDGSGQFTTVQAAVSAVPAGNKNPVTIRVKMGVYKEKILIDSLRPFITLEGENAINTIITWNDHTGKLAPNGDTINTRTSWTVKITAGYFTARDICFQNDAGFSAGQAIAVESDGDKAVFINCRFIGNQDVLFTNNPGSRQYYRNCYIEGTTDFIFGSSTAWFEQCHIHSKKNSHVTAASTPQEKPYGYVFSNCALTGDTSLHNVSLGRPWRPYASVTYLNCWLGPHIKPEGWSNWNNTENYKTARYAEYNNQGPGAATSGRLPWIRQLTATEAALYTLKNIFGAWQPE